MGRKPRIHLSGGFYHVILRGNSRQNIFLEQADWDIWQSLVRRVFIEYEHRLHAFCWMTNHVHMAIQAGTDPLAKAMSFLSSQYARRFNLRHQRTGHLFERRYRAILVQEDEYLKELVRYIHLNPVRARMVEHACDYLWSSHPAYLSKQSYEWLTDEYVLSLFGQTRYQATRSYKAFMADVPADAELKKLRCGGNDDRLLGEDTWLENVVEKDCASSQTGATPSLQDIITAVCSAHQIEEAALTLPRGPHEHAWIRAEIAMKAMDTGAASISEVARRFNRTQSALSQAIKHHKSKNL
ncbi:MAG: transposase [Gammaproteobacteria bacterium]|nr:transposase [Gammaproteobacteria bacterium]